MGRRHLRLLGTTSATVMFYEVENDNWSVAFEVSESHRDKVT